MLDARRLHTHTHMVAPLRWGESLAVRQHFNTMMFNYEYLAMWTFRGYPPITAHVDCNVAWGNVA